MKSDKYIYEKGIFPYEYFTDLSKFRDTCFSTDRSFFSKVNDERISENEYLRAQNIWKEFSYL